MELFNSPVLGAFVTVIGSGIFTVGAVILNKRTTPMSSEEKELIKQLREELKEKDSIIKDGIK